MNDNDKDVRDALKAVENARVELQNMRGELERSRFANACVRLENDLLKNKVARQDAEIKELRAQLEKTR